MAKDFWSDIERQGRERCKELANETADELLNEALNQTYEFYGEYTPRYYKRHQGAGTEHSGLAKSIERICHSEDHGRGYVGGIRISTEHMYTDYNGTPLQVLSSYLDGFHGLPDYGSKLRSIPKTDKFRYLVNYKNAIIKRFK